MKIVFTRDEVANLIEKHVIDGIGIPFDRQSQSIDIEIGSGYSGDFITITIDPRKVQE